VLVLSLVVAFAIAIDAPTATADTKSDLAAAKSRLAGLESQIGAQEQALTSLHAQLTTVVGQLAAATARYQTTLADIARITADLTASRNQYRQIRDRLDSRAAAVYMQGAGNILEVVLAARSYTDLADRLQFVSSLTRSDANLASEVERAADELGRKQLLLAKAKAEQALLVGQLNSQRTLVSQRFDAQQAALAQLSSARAGASSLIEELRKTLQKEELAAAQQALHGGTPIPFGQWAPLFLPRLGAPTCHNNLVLVVAWESTEYTMATWNPLATSYSMPGATLFNSSGVKNYVSLDQGLTAEVNTLEQTNPIFGYAPIVADLRACADPLTTADAINHSAYCACSGSYPLSYLIPFVESNYDFYAKICTGC
jgi:peptidoglycan hydrolase CwlO-like protein